MVFCDDTLVYDSRPFILVTYLRRRPCYLLIMFPCRSANKKESPFILCRIINIIIMSYQGNII